MARTYGKLLAEIWRNEDWLKLSGNAQRLYMLLLSQPKTTLVGLLDYMPDRWAALCSDWNTFEVQHAAVELEDARFVLMDDATGELLIRSFIKHDLSPNRLNVNVVKGVWSAWLAVSSAMLRSQLVHVLPQAVWTEERVDVPAEAVQMRCSEPIERTVRTDRYDGPSEQTVATTTLHSPPPTPLSPEEAARARSTREDEQSEQRDEGEAAARHRAKQAALVIASRQVEIRMRGGEQFTAPGTVAKLIASEDVWPLHRSRLELLAAEHPDACPDDLADMLGNANVAQRPDPLDACVAASLREFDRNDSRRSGLGCPLCDGTGWVDNGGATVDRCSCASLSAS